VADLRSIILGTAGHIDHGKTALVKALTGIDTDRLKEERRRGITIELGFAHMRLQDVVFGVVDVPGHERFIKSMVAGAGGIDMVMLVVAADEGVMPQTREHLDICQLLGVQRGCVALTKVDLVDREWLALVQEDLRQVMVPTFLHQAPIVPCSAVTGEGLEALRRVLLELAADVQRRDPRGLLRLPLDRVFTLKGFGTIVTGTLLSGTLRPGDEVAVLPTSISAKVRSVQVHGEEVDHAVAGQRTAVNLGGVDRQDVSRGEVLVHPGTLAPSSMIDVLVQLLPGTHKPLAPRSKVLFHIGTRQQEATCVLLEGGALEPGQQAVAQLRFELPVVALPGDRFILRGFRKQENYGTTVGGGTVLRVLSRRLKPRQTEEVALLRRHRAAQGLGPHGAHLSPGPSGGEPGSGAPAASAARDELQHVALELSGAGPTGLTRAQLQQRLPYVPAHLDKLLQHLRSRRQAIQYDADSGATVHGERWEQLKQRLLAMVEAHHAQHALEPGIDREELRSRLGAMIGPRQYGRLLAELEGTSQLVVERDVCRLPQHTMQTAASAIRPLADRIIQTYEGAGLAPPRDGTLAEALAARSADVTAAIRLLLDEGALVKAADLYFTRPQVERLQQRLVAFLREQGQITPPQFKELVGQSRKFTIPLAEYFDAQKVTLRVGDLRKLRA